MEKNLSNNKDSVKYLYLKITLNIHNKVLVLCVFDGNLSEQERGERLMLSSTFCFTSRDLQTGEF
jgi:hypothetical protein